MVDKFEPASGGRQVARRSLEAFFNVPGGVRAWSVAQLWMSRVDRSWLGQ